MLCDKKFGAKLGESLNDFQHGRNTFCASSVRDPRAFQDNGLVLAA